MWSIDFYDDPLWTTTAQPPQDNTNARSRLVLAKQPLSYFPAVWELWRDGAVAGGENGEDDDRRQKHEKGKDQQRRTIGVALADYMARQQQQQHGRLLRKSHHAARMGFVLEPLSLRRKKHASSSGGPTPYILERSDIFVVAETLHVYLRLVMMPAAVVVADGNGGIGDRQTCSTTSYPVLVSDVSAALDEIFDPLRGSNEETGEGLGSGCLRHIATAVFQERLRASIDAQDAVAFVADGSILPRQSGTSAAPMASPPAIPFCAPPLPPPSSSTASALRQTISIDMGRLARYLHLPKEASSNNTVVTLSGLLIPRGVTLIVGGGYHGKSTLLRCIAAGVYNKIPGDGREFSVTVPQALTIRAEDGRHVSAVNVSAFIANLPAALGAAVDTTQFSTREASGSTSQAANVVEAIEMGATAFLVDEDVSAANFMARDGRMRALVMDESITPFLYRVNGLFDSLGISSIVVVGGVGDWLDVPHAVILMDQYRCKDATAKARSISWQFSHGHVQYAGRGVVHRLPWDKSGTPIPRRPIVVNGSFRCHLTQVALLDGHQTISLKSSIGARQDSHGSNGFCAAAQQLDDNDNTAEHDEDDESNAMIDLSRIEQLLGRKAQVYGCGICVSHVLDRATRRTDDAPLSLRALLNGLDETIDERGLLAVLAEEPTETSTAATETCNGGHTTTSSTLSPSMQALIRSTGFAYRPRSLEVGQALARLPCVRFEASPIPEDVASEEARAKAEGERKQKELMDLWNSRRQKK